MDVLRELELSIRKTSLCNSLNICRQIFNFSNQVSAGSKSRYLFYNQRKSTFILLYFFGIFCCCHNLIFLQQSLYRKETPLVIETINFSGSFAFQKKVLNGAYFISDVRLLWFLTVLQL